MINFIKNSSPIIICDIGAAPIDKTEFIDELFNNTNCELIGFEPNEEEFNKLEKNNPRKTFYDYAIGDGSEKYLNICKGPGMTSFLEPDMDYLNNFHWFDDFAWTQSHNWTAYIENNGTSDTGLFFFALRATRR